MACWAVRKSKCHRCVTDAVDREVNLLVIEKDACKVGLRRRIEPGDPQFKAMSEAWSKALRDGFTQIVL